MRPCRKCGKTFNRPKEARGVRYCSNECNPNMHQCANKNCSVWYYSDSGKVYCSKSCKTEVISRRGFLYHEKKTNCGTCNSEFTMTSSLDKYCSDECRPNRVRCGEYGCDTWIQWDRTRVYCSEHRHVNGIRPSKQELLLIPALEAEGFVHTGAGTFWRAWKDGSRHNPDFVNVKTKTVFEYFGSYYHRHHRGLERQIVDSWKEIGWDCEILWSENLWPFLQLFAQE